MVSDLAILTAKPDLPIYRELESAAAAVGHHAVVLNALDLVARADQATVYLRGEKLPLEPLVAVLPRVGNWRPDSVLAVLAALNAAGVPGLNRPQAIRRGRDHWRTACALAAAGLPHPETVAGSEPEALAAAAAVACGFPCVVKQRRSRQGTGVIKVASRAELEAVLDSMWRVGDEVVVQRFCPPGGVSRRVLVLDGEVLGVTEHRAAEGEFRTNAARGGRVEAVTLEEDQAMLALAAAGAAGLAFAGVDLLPDGNRVVVGEVNPTPGWKHFQEATGVAVAARLVASLLRLGGTR
jgi:RimK family alpha-L-glutamate ligase